MNGVVYQIEWRDRAKDEGRWFYLLTYANKDAAIADCNHKKTVEAQRPGSRMDWRVVRITREVVE